MQYCTVPTHPSWKLCSLPVLSFFSLLQKVLMHAKVGPTGDVRGFRWCHPEIRESRREEKHPTKISALFTEKSGPKRPKTAIGSSVGRHSLSALVSLRSLKL